MLAMILQTQGFDLISALWQLGPVFALMAIAIIYLARKLDKLTDVDSGIGAKKDEQIKELARRKEDEITDLHDYIRENDRENLEVLTSINNTLDKLIHSFASGNEALKEKMITEAKGIKAHIDRKISELKDKK